MTPGPSELVRRLDSRRIIRNARNAGRLRFLMPLFNLLLRLESSNPKTFNQKVRYKIARDRRPLLTVFADKLDAKEYVERNLGSGLTPRTLASAKHAADLPWSDLPKEVAFKVNHGSGGGVIVRRDADPAARVPDATIENSWKDLAAVTPGNADRNRIANLLDLHLGLNFFWVFGEWGYRNVVPRAFAEELVRGPDNGDPTEYRLYCFSGRCGLIIVGTALIHPEPPLDIFLPDWTHLPATRPGTTRHIEVPERPGNLAGMIEVAETLSAETDFLRVDLLSSGEQFRVGELTNYPYAGRLPVEPPRFERWMGDLWDLPRDYSNLPYGAYPRSNDLTA